MEREQDKFSLNKDSLSDQVYKKLREAILNINLEPGERMPVNELEEDFGVSRAPIREALNRLANQGLVEVEPRVGYFVVDLSMSQIEELYDIRKLFETHALEHSLPSIKDEDLRKIRQETVTLLEEDLSYEKLRSRFDVTDKKLHWELIIGNSGNQYLQKFSKKIYDFVYFTRHLVERIPKALEEHLSIIDSLYNEDCENVKEALSDHIENHLLSLKEKDFDYASQLYNEKNKVEN